MKFSLNTVYYAPVARTLDVLVSEDLAAARARALGVESYDYERRIDENGQLSTVLRTRVPGAKLPEKVRGFLPQGISVLIETQILLRNPTQSTSTPAQSISNPAQSTSTALCSSPDNPVVLKHMVRAEGIPVTAEIFVKLEPTSQEASLLSQKEGTQTKAHISGSYSVMIPFVRSKIETMIEANLERILTEDAHVVNSILSPRDR